MSETPEDKLKKHLTHSTKLGDIIPDLSIRALPCEFPSMEDNEYLVKGEGRVTVLAARPGNGKTAFACQIGLNVSKYGRCLFFSLEMSKDALTRRLLAVTTGVPIKKLGLPMYKSNIEAATRLHQSYKFDIIDEQGLNVDQIITKTYDEYQNGPIDLVVIDYVGLVAMDNSTRALSMKMVIEKLKKKLAEPLKMPILLLAQMKRGFEDRYARAKMEYEKAKHFPTGANEKILDIRPSLEDLGESSGLEHTADVVMFLFRPYLLNPEIDPRLFKVFVAKNRSGVVKDFDLEFSPELTRFVDRGDIL